MGLVHIGGAAAPDEREAIPEERFGFGGQRAGRPTGSGRDGARPSRAGRGGELAVGVVGKGAALLALGHGQHLVEIAVAVGLRALPDHAARRVVNVLCHRAVGGRGADELVCLVVLISRDLAADLLLEDVPRRIVGVPLAHGSVQRDHLQELPLGVVEVLLGDAVRKARDDLPVLPVPVAHV